MSRNEASRASLLLRVTLHFSTMQDASAPPLDAKKVKQATAAGVVILEWDDGLRTPSECRRGSIVYQRDPASGLTRYAACMHMPKAMWERVCEHDRKGVLAFPTVPAWVVGQRVAPSAGGRKTDKIHSMEPVKQWAVRAVGAWEFVDKASDKIDIDMGASCFQGAGRFVPVNRAVRRRTKAARVVPVSVPGTGVSVALKKSAQASRVERVRAERASWFRRFNRRETLRVALLRLQTAPLEACVLPGETRRPLIDMTIRQLVREQGVFDGRKVKSVATLDRRQSLEFVNFVLATSTVVCDASRKASRFVAAARLRQERQRREAKADGKKAVVCEPKANPRQSSFERRLRNAKINARMGNRAPMRVGRGLLRMLCGEAAPWWQAPLQMATAQALEVAVAV